MAMGPNQTILRKAYERFAVGDAEHLYSVLADDVTWKVSGDPQRIAFAGTHSGKDGVRSYFAASRSEWDIVQHDPIEIFSNGDTRFAVRVRVEAQHKRTGGHIKFEKLDMVSMDKGKCTEYCEVFDTALLEVAAGLGPVESVEPGANE